jgi:triphosphatase
MNTSEAFHTIAWNCLDHLHNNEAGMRERADPEYLHQMWVCIAKRAFRSKRVLKGFFEVCFCRDGAGA